MALPPLPASHPASPPAERHHDLAAGVPIAATPSARLEAEGPEGGAAVGAKGGDGGITASGDALQTPPPPSWPSMPPPPPSSHLLLEFASFTRRSESPRPPRSYAASWPAAAPPELPPPSSAGTATARCKSAASSGCRTAGPSSCALKRSAGRPRRPHLLQKHASNDPMFLLQWTTRDRPPRSDVARGDWRPPPSTRGTCADDRGRRDRFSRASRAHLCPDLSDANSSAMSCVWRRPLGAGVRAQLRARRPRASTRWPPPFIGWTGGNSYDNLPGRLSGPRAPSRRRPTMTTRSGSPLTLSSSRRRRRHATLRHRPRARRTSAAKVSVCSTMTPSFALSATRISAPWDRKPIDLLRLLFAQRDVHIQRDGNAHRRRSRAAAAGNRARSARRTCLRFELRLIGGRDILQHEVVHAAEGSSPRRAAFSSTAWFVDLSSELSVLVRLEGTVPDAVHLRCQTGLVDAGEFDGELAQRR